MSVHEILSEEFVAELPDDPQTAFCMVLRKAEGYLAEAQKMRTREEDWSYYQDAQYNAMNAILGTARTYRIEPFVDTILPPRSRFTSEQFDDFKADLDHYAVQLVLDNSIRAKRDAIEIDPKIRDRLRQHAHAIRTLIDQAEMPEACRAALLKKIAEFEVALEKPRINVAALAALMVGLLAAAANVTVLADSPAMGKIVATVMSTLGHAKAVDNANRELPPGQPPQPLLPPRPADYVPEPVRASGPRETFAADLDDEIPF